MNKADQSGSFSIYPYNENDDINILIIYSLLSIPSIVILLTFIRLIIWVTTKLFLNN